MLHHSIGHLQWCFDDETKGAVGRMNPPHASAACSIAVGLIFPLAPVGGKFCAHRARRGIAFHLIAAGYFEARVGVLVFARRELIVAVN